MHVDASKTVCVYDVMSMCDVLLVWNGHPAQLHSTSEDVNSRLLLLVWLGLGSLANSGQQSQTDFGICPELMRPLDTKVRFPVYDEETEESLTCELADPRKHVCRKRIYSCLVCTAQQGQHWCWTQFFLCCWCPLFGFFLLTWRIVSLLCLFHCLNLALFVNEASLRCANYEPNLEPKMVWTKNTRWNGYCTTCMKCARKGGTLVSYYTLQCICIVILK